MFGLLFGVYVWVCVFRIAAHDEIVFILSQRSVVIALRRKRFKACVDWSVVCLQTVCTAHQNQHQRVSCCLWQVFRGLYGTKNCVYHRNRAEKLGNEVMKRVASFLDGIGPRWQENLFIQTWRVVIKHHQEFCELQLFTVMTATSLAHDLSHDLCSTVCLGSGRFNSQADQMLVLIIKC